MMGAWALVAAGGAVGALARYASVMLAGALLGGSFPYGTLAVNVVGGFAIGALAGVLAVGEALHLFLVVGILGGFTTFSAFSIDVVNLMQQGRIGEAAIYVTASVFLSVGAAFAGVALGRVLA